MRRGIALLLLFSSLRLISDAPAAPPVPVEPVKPDSATQARTVAVPPARPDLYDEKADGKTQIAAAQASARPGGKRVLLMFGANWCGWCHRLHRVFREDSAIAARLKQSYEVVLIDINKGHNDAVSRAYGQEVDKGVPYLIVLDVEGKVVTRQETGALEQGDHHDPKLVLAFLDKWAAK